MSRENREKQKRKRKEAARKRAVRATKLVRATEQMTDGLDKVADKQRRLFVEKFGREPTTADPLFFDPDKDVPTEMGDKCIQDNAIEAAALIGVDAAILHAMRKTRMIIYEDNRHLFSKEEWQRWTEAVDEHRDAHPRAKSASTETSWQKVLRRA